MSLGQTSGTVTTLNDFNVDGDATFDGAATVTGATTLSSTLAVSGAATFSNDATISGTLSLGDLTDVESSINSNTNSISGNSSGISSINSKITNFSSGARILEDGSYNLGFGTGALSAANGPNIGSENIAIGYNALYWSSGGENIALGVRALYGEVILQIILPLVKMQDTTLGVMVDYLLVMVQVIQMVQELMPYI